MSYWVQPLPETAPAINEQEVETDTPLMKSKRNEKDDLEKE